MGGVRARDIQGYEAREAFSRARFAVIPFGALEEHGPIGNLGMDTDPPDYLADEVAKRLGGIVLPTIEYSFLPLYTRHRPGTISVRHEVMVGLVSDVIRGAYDNGVRGVVIINGNGTNVGISEAAAETVCESYPDRFLLVVNCWDVLSDELLRSLFPGDRGDGHGGAWETSVMQALRPDAAYDLRKWGDKPFRTLPGRGMRIHADGRRGIYREDWSGYEGAISAASPEKGRRVLEASVDAIAKAVSQLLERAAL